MLKIDAKTITKTVNSLSLSIDENKTISLEFPCFTSFFPLFCPLVLDEETVNFDSGLCTGHAGYRTRDLTLEKSKVVRWSLCLALE
jgi:hypothetical protein